MIFLELHRFNSGAVILLNADNIAWIGPRTNVLTKVSQYYSVVNPDAEPASDGGTIISLNHGGSVDVRENFDDLFKRIRPYVDMPEAAAS